MSTIKDYYETQYEHKKGVTQEEEATFRLRVNAALQAMPSPPKRILDYGCGQGGASRIFVDAGYEVVGMDVSEVALKAARQKVPEATFSAVEVENNIPAEDASFDICYATELIEHLFDVQGYLREVHRILRPNGYLLLTTPYHGWVKNMLVVSFAFEKHFRAHSGHIRFFSKKSITHYLVEAGFSVEDFQGIGRCWPVWKTMFVKAKKQ